MTVYVTADWSRVVPVDDPEAAFGVDESDIDSRGLRAQVEAMRAPKPEPPTAKAMPAPANKAVLKAANK
jgi:hypothetical protein